MHAMHAATQPSMRHTRYQHACLSQPSKCCRRGVAARYASSRGEVAQEAAHVAVVKGRPRVRVAEGHEAVPLIDPAETQLPFAIAIETISGGASPWRPATPTAQQGSGLVHLQLVLAGQGTATFAGDITKRIRTGHSLLVHHDRQQQQQPKGYPYLTADAGSTLCVLSCYLPAAATQTPAAVQQACQQLLRSGVLPWRQPSSRQTGVVTQAHEVLQLLGHPGGAAWALGIQEEDMEEDGSPPSSSSHDSGDSLLRSPEELPSFQLPAQTNRLAFLLEPSQLPHLPISVGLEVFNPGHVTPLHVHHTAHEVFFILSGAAEAIHGSHRTLHGPGDCIAVPPGVRHGINVPINGGKLFTLQMMLPDDDMFAEMVKSGQPIGRLSDQDLCELFSLRC